MPSQAQIHRRSGPTCECADTGQHNVPTIEQTESTQRTCSRQRACSESATPKEPKTNSTAHGTQCRLPLPRRACILRVCRSSGGYSSSNYHARIYARASVVGSETRLNFLSALDTQAVQLGKLTGKSLRAEKAETKQSYLAHTYMCATDCP